MVLASFGFGLLEFISALADAGGLLYSPERGRDGLMEAVEFRPRFIRWNSIFFVMCGMRVFLLFYPGYTVRFISST